MLSLCPCSQTNNHSHIALDGPEPWEKGGMQGAPRCTVIWALKTCWEEGGSLSEDGDGESGSDGGTFGAVCKF